MVKKILSVLLVTFGAVFFSAQNVFAAESISLFESTIAVNKNGSLDIREVIHYTTTESRHGIYRYIPLSYAHDGYHRRLQISVTAVTDDTRSPLRYETFVEEGNLVIKIGDPTTTFTGNRSFLISYSVDRGMVFNGSTPTFLWDITGEGWTMEIEAARARILTPGSQIVSVACYSGVFGQDTGECKFEQNTSDGITLIHASPIEIGSNMTVQVEFNPKAAPYIPTGIHAFAVFFRDNWQLFLFPLTALLSFYLWYTKGRDWVFISQNIFSLDKNQPQMLRPVFDNRRTRFVYEPLTALSPGEAGLLLDERVDNQDIVAEIITLARKKYISITEIAKKKLIFTTKDYQLKKLSPPSSKQDVKRTLTSTQAYLLKELFSKNDSVTIESLKGSFYKNIAHAKMLLNNQVTAQQWFTKNPSNTRGIYIGLFSIVIAAEFFLALSIAPYVDGLQLMGNWLICSLTSLYFAFNMPQKTAIGSNLSMQAQGLRQMIKTGSWRQEINEKHLFIEDVLPFAISLGVVHQLAKHMEALNLQPPNYLGGLHAVSASRFADSLQGFTESASSNLNYNPSSSSSSSGGGFSGGGGGGGGGGSW